MRQSMATGQTERSYMPISEAIAEAVANERDAIRLYGADHFAGSGKQIGENDEQR